MSILIISVLIGLISSISYVTINFSILDLGTMHSALALDQNSTESETSDGGEALYFNIFWLRCHQLHSVSLKSELFAILPDMG